MSGSKASINKFAKNVTNADNAKETIAANVDKVCITLGSKVFFAPKDLCDDALESLQPHALAGKQADALAVAADLLSETARAAGFLANALAAAADDALKTARAATSHAATLYVYAVDVSSDALDANIFAANLASSLRKAVLAVTDLRTADLGRPATFGTKALVINATYVSEIARANTLRASALTGDAKLAARNARKAVYRANYLAIDAALAERTANNASAHASALTIAALTATAALASSTNGFTLCTNGVDNAETRIAYFRSLAADILGGTRLVQRSGV